MRVSLCTTTASLTDPRLTQRADTAASQPSPQQTAHDAGEPPQPDRAPTEAAGEARGSAVRFSSRLQEIEPSNSLHLTETLTPENERSASLSPEAQAELRHLSLSLQQSRLQEGRLSNFAFEPVSLPPSRVSRHSYSVLSQHMTWRAPNRKADLPLIPGSVSERENLPE